MFALVIGINEYASDEYDNLTAAAGDADRFENFLRDKLKVPREHVISLRDKNATRAGILTGFLALRDDPRIVKDEAAIIIYFAGHGARADKPAEWDDWVTASGQIEVMCPSDMGLRDAIGEEIAGIPDRTIAVLLNRISERKGNNITLILDCCNSGGLNRTAWGNDPMKDGYVPRQVHTSPRLSPRCDEDILSNNSVRGAGLAIGYAGKHHASHILLAACGREQVAYEDPRTNCGMFTSSLLKTLSKYNVSDLTYTALMHRLPMPIWQTPHCEGQHVSRRLFNKRGTGADGAFIFSQIAKTEDGTELYILHAGAAQGITEGSVFEVHITDLITDSRHANPPCGWLVVSNVRAFRSELTFPPNTPDFDIPRLFYCKLISRQRKEIKVYCADKEWLLSVFPSETCQTLSITLTSTASEAHLQLSLLDGKVQFLRNDPMINPWLQPQLPHSIKKTEIHAIREVVRCWVHFTYHLTRRASSEFKGVWMELRELGSKHSASYDGTLCPFGPNLIENEPAGLVVDEDARLGMVIHNRTDRPLYPYLFYFDPSDLLIIEWYTPPFGAGQGRLTTDVDAPLPPQGSLTIGYGSGGVSPWQFLLRDNDDMDVGFFKLFLTTSPADFSSIPQESPFEDINTRSRRMKVAFPDDEGWGTILSTVVQLRSAKQLPLENVDA
ncbi:hypothetical protein H0H92_001457 [Tricholoma furcatifolium]|nr:hypothetical protein H0H92_001457 [Tricholoma furcatifolium]